MNPTIARKDNFSTDITAKKEAHIKFTDLTTHEHQNEPRIKVSSFE
jgi:hypothetical protein